MRLVLNDEITVHDTYHNEGNFIVIHALFPASVDYLFIY